jgi:hypothetical protein
LGRGGRRREGLWKRSIETGRIIPCGYVGTSTSNGSARVEDARVFVGRSRNGRRKGSDDHVGVPASASGAIRGSVGVGHVRRPASGAAIACDGAVTLRSQSKVTRQKGSVAERSDGRTGQMADPRVPRLIGACMRESEHTPSLVMPGDGVDGSVWWCGVVWRGVVWCEVR